MTRLHSTRRFAFASASGWIEMAVLLAVLSLLVSIAPAQGQTVIATVPVGSAPVGLALNRATNKVYVSNNGSGNITVIDGATNTATTVTNSNIQALWGIAVNPVTNKVYVPTGSTLS